VVRALLADKTFHVRGVTRNPGSPAAQSLQSRGVEVVEANLLNVDSVEKAVAGSEAVFGVTNFFDSDNFDAAKVQQLRSEPEILQGQNLVEASKEAGVKFFIWSSLPSSSDVSKAVHATNPKIREFTGIKHFDNKAAIDKTLATSGLNYAIIDLGWFLENTKPTKNIDGSYTISVPNFKAEEANPEQAFTWVSRDLGPAVLALLKNYQTLGSQILGKTFFVVGEKSTYQQLAKLLSESTGKVVRFSAEGKLDMAELDDMNQYLAQVGLYRHKQIPDPHLVALGVKLSDLSEFAADENVKAMFS
jgi:uncharacterized protein YbjT (DUF2867 family)